MPVAPTKESFKHIDFVHCMDCMFNENGDLVPRERKDFIRTITYDNNIDTNKYRIHYYTFVNHYLYYTALKFIESFGEEGVKDTEVINKIENMVYPNRIPAKTRWSGIFYYVNTPLRHGVNRISPRTYAINYWGLQYIYKHEKEFEK